MLAKYFVHFQLRRVNERYNSGTRCLFWCIDFLIAFRKVGNDIGQEERGYGFGIWYP